MQRRHNHVLTGCHERPGPYAAPGHPRSVEAETQLNLDRVPKLQQSGIAKAKGGADVQQLIAYRNCHYGRRG